MSLNSWVLGVDIGGTNTKMALVSPSGEMQQAHHFRTDVDKGFESFVRELQGQVRQYLINCSIEKEESIPIGMGVPNYSSRSGRLVSPVNLSWGDIHFYDKLKSAFSENPLYLENDANLAALGEKEWGLAKECSDFAVVTVGTGIGLGLFVNNRLVTGYSGLASEGGHLVVSPGGRPCGCGGLGHFESHCSVKAIKNRLLESCDEDLHYHEIVPRFKGGDPQLREVFLQVAEDFAVGLQQIHCLLSPQKIILAGGGMAAGDSYLMMIVEAFEKLAYKPMLDSVQIEMSQLSVSDGAVLGAAALVFQNSK